MAVEAAALKEENDIIKAKAGRPQEAAPRCLSQRVRDQRSVLPGLQSGAEDHADRAREFVPGRVHGDLDSESDQKPDPGLLSLHDWALERHFSAETAEHVAALRAEIEALKKAQVPYPFLHGASDTKTMQAMHVNVRGNPHTPGDPVPERFLSVLSPPDPKPFSKGSGRLELADAIVASPIAARVIVNRVWKWHFGSGIVETPGQLRQDGRSAVQS